LRFRKTVVALSALAAAAVLSALAFFFFRAARAEASHTPPGGKNLVIYSPHPPEITDYIVREFRQRTGIKATVIYAGTGELIERMKSRKGKNEADIFWGGGIESLETVADYFAEYRSSEDRFIDPRYLDPERRWYPFSVLSIVIIYNESLVPETRIPTSWDDLLDPAFRDRVIMADPTKSGSSYTILATMLLTKGSGDKAAPFSGWGYVDRLIGQLGDDGLTSNSQLVYHSVATGDFYAGVTFENYALALRKTGANVGICYPSEGTSAVPDGVALIAEAGHPEQAKAFIDFALGEDVQRLLPARWQRRSVRLGIPSATGSDSAVDQDGATFIAYPIRNAANARDKILERWSSSYAARQ